MDVYAASLDEVAALAEFAEAQKLGFKLLSDPDASAVNKYGVKYEKRDFAKRVTFVIDPKGILRHVDEGVQVDSHGDDLVQVVRKLQGKR